MNRNIKLTISGLHAGDSGDDKIETAVQAQYFGKDRNRFVIYEERDEQFPEPIKSRIKFREDYLEITRQGFVNTHMVFEKDKKNPAQYRMPYGDIQLETNTHSIEVCESEDQIHIRVKYALEINGEHQADSDIVINMENL